MLIFICFGLEYGRMRDRKLALMLDVGFSGGVTSYGKTITNAKSVLDLSMD